jgi:hypothetical protein
MDTNEEIQKIPFITTAIPRWGQGNYLLHTIGGERIPYTFSGKLDYHKIEESFESVKAFREFLSEIPTSEERRAVIIDEFNRWDTKEPDFEFAGWLIQQYKTVEINCLRDKRRLEQATKGTQKSWGELLKERDEEISELKSRLNEKEAIIKQKTKEHDDYVANHGTSNDDGTKWLMKINKEDIYLSLKEYTIILYALFRHASGKEKLTANQKRLIGSYNTVDAYINHSKKEGKHPLTEDEKNRIKKVLNSEQIPYKEILKDYL